MTRRPTRFTLFPYTTLFRSDSLGELGFSTNEARAYKGLLVDSPARSEVHTSELQSHSDLVCRLLREKKKLTGLSGAGKTTLAARRATAVRARGIRIEDLDGV